MPKKLGFDVDGVFAEFTSKYAALLIKEDGDRLPKGWKTDPTFPSTWYWERAAGYPREVETRVWEQGIIPSASFWYSLKPLPGAEETLRHIDTLTKAPGLQCFFITNRSGNNPKRQTERWLYNKGMVEFPTVITTAVKGPVIHALDLDFYIDDKLETVNETCALAQNVMPKLKGHVYMPDYPYNRIGRHSDVIVVKDVAEALQREGLWKE